MVAVAAAINEQIQEFKVVLENARSVPFHDERQREACEELLRELSENEREIAASSSYAYWWLKKQHVLDCTVVSEDCIRDAQRTMALRELRRHHVGEKGDREKTLRAVREAIAYRLEYDFDSIRSCITTNDDPAIVGSGTTTLVDRETGAPLTLRDLREMITDELTNNQELVVRGCSRQKHAIIYKQPRYAKTVDTNPQAYLLANLYIAERGLAATEYITKGVDERVFVVFNFTDYLSANAPPSELRSVFTKLLQRTYPERLQTLAILNPPIWIRIMLNVVFMFLSYETREKIKLLTDLTSEQQQEAVFGSVVDKSQATPYLLADGELVSDVDMTAYLSRVPFHRLYDDPGSDGASVDGGDKYPSHGSTTA